MFVLANISFFEMPYEFFCIWIYYNIYRKILSMLVRYWKITWLWTWVHVQVLDNMVVDSNYEQYLNKNLFNLILAYMISINIGFYFNQNNTLCKSIWWPFTYTFFIHLGVYYWFFALKLKILGHKFVVHLLFLHFGLLQWLFVFLSRWILSSLYLFHSHPQLLVVILFNVIMNVNWIFWRRNWRLVIQGEQLASIHFPLNSQQSN